MRKASSKDPASFLRAGWIWSTTFQKKRVPRFKGLPDLESSSSGKWRSLRSRPRSRSGLQSCECAHDAECEDRDQGRRDHGRQAIAFQIEFQLSRIRLPTYIAFCIFRYLITGK